MKSQFFFAGGMAENVDFIQQILYNQVNTCIPGEIVDFNAELQTATVRICIKSGVLNKNVTGMVYDSPVQIPCVPVWFPYTTTKGFSLTYDVSPGDQCLLVFSQRSIDKWLEAGSVQPPGEPFFSRHFSIADAIALVGLIPNPSAIRSFQQRGIEIRNRDRNVYVQVTDDFVHLQAMSVDGSAGCTIESNIQGDIVAQYSKDKTITVGNNHICTIEGNSSIQIKKNYSLTVLGEFVVSVTKASQYTYLDSLTHTVTKNASFTFLQNLTVQVSGNYELTVSGEFSVTAQISVTGKVKSTSYSTIDDQQRERVGVSGDAGPNNTVTFINGIAVAIS